MPTKIESEEEALWKQGREKYSTDMYALAEDLLGFDAMYEPLHRKVCDWLNDWKPGKHIKMLLIPRGHLKSTLGSVTFPIYNWINRPTDRTLMVHGVLKIGMGYVRDLKNKIVTPELPWLFPEIFHEKPSSQAQIWHQDKFTLKQNNSRVPSFILASEGTQTVGYHYNLIICDDLVHEKNVATKELREKTKYFFHNLMPQRLGDARVLVLGTRWHHDDLYGYLMDEENPFHEKLDAWVMDCGYPGDPIFPRQPGKQPGHTRESLAAQKASMDPYSWSCQYMNDPTPQETQHFRRADIHVFDFWEGERLPIDDDVTVEYYTAVDPNRSEKTEHDPAVVLTVAIDSNGHYWVVDMSRGHPDGPQLVDWIRAHAVRWNPKKVLVEASNFQLQLGSWLKEDMVKTGFAYSLDMLNRGPNQKKFERIARMEAMTKQKRLHVRRGLDAVLNELEFFPRYKNDDAVDALADVFQYGQVPKKRRVSTENEAPRTGFLLNTMVDDMLEEQERVGVYRVMAPGVRRV